MQEGGGQLGSLALRVEEAGRRWSGGVVLWRERELWPVKVSLVGGMLPYAGCRLIVLYNDSKFYPSLI